MPSVFIKTYGCQMNERDSEAVAAQLVAKGYALAPSEATADVILLNTCSVRDNAEQTAIKKMENLAGQYRERRPDVVLGFMGCMAQSRGKELIDRLPDVDLVLGTQKFHRAAEYLDDLLAGRRKKVVDTEEEQGSEATIREHLLNGKGAKAATAFVSIMQGCNQYCTFCIVPYTRGEERSRTIPDIVSECRALVAGGVREITLLGQIVTSFGKREKRDAWRVASGANGGNGGNGSIASPDTRHPSPPTGDAVRDAWRVASGVNGAIPSLDTRHPSPDVVASRDTRHLSPFVQLIEAVHEIEGLERIRFTSPHPKGYGDDLVEAYTRLPKLCESAHLPVQSGSDRMLKLMHRGYTRERYLEIIRKLRAAKPEIGLCTDIIVGFPGETEEDFAQTCSLVREVGFDQAYIFKYSQRKDTPAAAMPDQLSQEVIEERHARLFDCINEVGREKHNAFVGRTVQILVEGPSKKNDARLAGRTRCNKIVVFEGADRHRHQLMDLKITRASNFTLYGDPAIVNLA